MKTAAVSVSFVYLLLVCAVHAKKGSADPMAGLGGLGGPLGGLKLQLHGHYCGLNHGDGTYNTAPIDDLDALCKKHDKCYDGFYLDCRCDHSFLVGLDQFLKSKVSEELKRTAKLMRNWFTTSACSCADEDGKRTQLSPANFNSKASCKRHNNKVRDEL